MTAICQDLAENMKVAAISKKYGIPRTTLRDNIERAVSEVQKANGLRWAPSVGQD